MRNLVETYEIIREFKSDKVGVYFEKENLYTLKTASDFIYRLLNDSGKLS